jgi:hypothetical protein
MAKHAFRKKAPLKRRDLYAHVYYFTKKADRQTSNLQLENLVFATCEADV